MEKQAFIVVGLDAFGLTIVQTLSKTDVDLLVIDRNPKRLEDAADLVLNAVCADARDPDILKQLGVSGFHGAVVSSDHLEDSVLISMLLKEAGVPFVLVKAATELEGRVLRKVGADKVIIPDLEMGIRVANQIAEGGYSTASKEIPEEPGPQPGYLGPE